MTGPEVRHERKVPMVTAVGCNMKINDYSHLQGREKKNVYLRHEKFYSFELLV
jgi:hypothetical protein